ncbi:MAG: hypothetical protein HOC71_17870 [Candidatus Latescibacteria bacterium]|jgi:uncharacterized protein (UPF0332 family)|nr:hypothetical protein [Candidatus Latescibacterota bacterium]
MSFDWTKFLDVAEQLIPDKEENPDDALLRTSISRSYYGAYGVAYTFFEQEGGVRPTENTHISIHSIFKESQNDLVCEIGNGLGSLWIERKKADYKKESIWSLNQVKLLLIKARMIVSNVKEAKRNNLSL